ncbi:MAG: hypothetical protein JWQ58_332 [Reyranella sp.]|nr:hypothetical protein [Reyranella sp.]
MFNWSLKQGSSLLFGAAAIILLVAVIQTVAPVLASLDVRAPTYAGRLFDAMAKSWQISLPVLVSGLGDAVLPFFCALVIQRIDLWLQVDRKIVAAASAPAPSWLFRQGARFMLALSLIFFLAATLELVLLVLQSMTFEQVVYDARGIWLRTVWNGAMLLFAALALDRLDRWLAPVRPCSD